VVIGGGITALELVEGLRVRGVRTHYFMRGDRYWANVLDEAESRVVEERLKAEGVVIHYRTEIQAALGRKKTLAGVETTTGEKLPCHILGVAIGVRPRLELAHQAGLKLDRGILVDEFLRTSAPDVFAAGDVAQVRDPRTGRAILDTLWSTALAQGRAAGANMTEACLPYVKQVPLNVTQLADLMTTIIGAVGSGRDQDLVTISRGNSEAWSLLPQAQVIVEKHDVNRIRLLVGERTLVGAVVMGDQTLSRPLHRLIAEQADITPIRAVLGADPASAVSLISDFYRTWERDHDTPAH
jgi:NADPH-dependent 2,4-dienoyl-CoA reductase/sulfur reductase-like enzyme